MQWQGSETILVVDDDDDARRTVTRVLKRLGYKVHQEGDPREAIPFFEEHQPEIDLLLTDVVMPAMNGLTLVERLTRTDPALRVLYMSGYIQGEVSWSGVPGSVTGFLEKPITIDELGKAVRGILDMVV
jgi:two-component system cell cycle sensor histidine kinase/response regulator CckA